MCSGAKTDSTPELLILEFPLVMRMGHNILLKLLCENYSNMVQRGRSQLQVIYTQCIELRPAADWEESGSQVIDWQIDQLDA